MKYKKETVLAGVFVIVLFVVGAVTWVTGASKIGYRMYYEFFSEIPEEYSYAEAIRAGVKEGEAAFVDNLFLRDAFASIDTNIKFLLTGELSSTQVLLGKENWLFYKTENDGNPLADYQGTLFYSEDTIKKIRENLLALEALLKEKNAKLILLIPPNKEQIYFDFMPEEIIKGEVSRADHLVSYLRDTTELSIVYPKQELIQMRSKTLLPLYYKYDSHWNQLGAYVAEQEILKEIFGKGKDLWKQNILKSTAKVHDLVDLIQMNWYFDNEDDYMVKKSFYDTDRKKNYNRKAVHNNRVLIIGDSFRSAMLPHLFYDFKWVYSKRRVNVDLDGNQYLMDTVESCKPEIVIFECTERYLGYLEQLYP